MLEDFSANVLKLYYIYIFIYLLCIYYIFIYLLLFIYYIVYARVLHVQQHEVLTRLFDDSADQIVRIHQRWLPIRDFQVLPNESSNTTIK